MGFWFLCFLYGAHSFD